MSTNSGGYAGVADVKRRLRSISVRRFWIWSKISLTWAAIYTARGRAEAVASQCSSALSSCGICSCELQYVQEVCCHEWDSNEEMMALTRDAHKWALPAVAILEERMEWMGHSLSHQYSSSHQCSGSCQHSGSPQHRRSRSSGHRGDPQVTYPPWGNLSPDQSIPRWLHAEGAPSEDGPSIPVPPGRGVGWSSLKGGHPCQQKRAWNVVLENMRPTSYPSQCGKLRRLYMERLIGWGWWKRLGLS